jgi:putative SOS response-associated peptidase YedK
MHPTTMTLKDIFSYSRVAVKEAKVVSKEWGRVSTWADAGIVRKGGAHLIGLKLDRLGSAPPEWVFLMSSHRCLIC